MGPCKLRCTGLSGWCLWLPSLLYAAGTCCDGHAASLPSTALRCWEGMSWAFCLGSQMSLSRLPPARATNRTVKTLQINSSTCH